MSWARIAVSASTVTTCGCTSRMPPETAKSSCSPLGRVTTTLPGFSRVISGACLRRDAELADLAGGNHQHRLAVEDLLLGADDVATESWMPCQVLNGGKGGLECAIVGRDAGGRRA